MWMGGLSLGMTSLCMLLLWGMRRKCGVVIVGFVVVVVVVVVVVIVQNLF